MKSFRNAIFAVLAIVCATAVATPGVSMDVSYDSGGLAIASITGAPGGSYIEAVVDIGGVSYVVDMAPADGGMAAVQFPVGHTNRSVVLRGPAGTVLSYQGEVEFD